ncbi:predicted protein [Pyrenophora tritici-repentis Pt-1C-BFP]|uniref:Uncharacterized protein n=1 Tax=Pyrenophora tritici-repentis (strain Pt-1C-BFP) TaxID=426418 RepID=B2WJ34_PYRTR|nr:uncharacterized protein PTRG_09993 [Pyrenophora tritici-repentis Pt-1C-BFP]EDU43044.1 predicted protein [Pyrenophora tritici-repentis Pt-1C-BFP]
MGSFNARVKRSRRWYEAATKLGWGCLLLMPVEIVTVSWVEQTLLVSEWSL